ncbi:MAG: formyltransferase family protein [Candidatus ainarchaeum sp.]|nr:formyltransferase family protein [Candidatus ainarchaeum sp.]
MRFGKINNYILMGQGEVLFRLAKMVKQRGHGLLVVISPRDRGDKVPVDGGFRSLEDLLKSESIEFMVSQDINNEAALKFRITKNTLGISSGAAWLFKGAFIKLFEGRLINLHGTRLPQDRGGGGFSWRILRGERVGYSIVHRIDEGVDTGSILKCREYVYPHSCRVPADYQKYSASKYIEMLEEFLGEVEKEKDFQEASQQEYFSAYWPRLATDIHGYINWGWKLEDIDRFICAFDDPYKGAATFINGTKARLKKSGTWVNDGPFHPFQKGMVYRISGGNVFVATESGTLILGSVEDDNGASMIQKIKVGDRFYTPAEHLEKAMQFRAVYTSTGLKP